MKSYLYQVVSIYTHKLLLENYIFYTRLTIVGIFFISSIKSSHLAHTAPAAAGANAYAVVNAAAVCLCAIVAADVAACVVVAAAAAACAVVAAAAAAAACVVVAAVTACVVVAAAAACAVMAAAAAACVVVAAVTACVVVAAAAACVVVAAAVTACVVRSRIKRRVSNTCCCRLLHRLHLPVVVKCCFIIIRQSRVFVQLGNGLHTLY
jgi:hypothetical protein